MPGFSNLDWGDWFYGLMAAGVTGGAGSVTAGVVTSSLDPTASRSFALGTWLNIKLMMISFIVNGMLGMFMYLNKNPMPRTMERVVTDKTTIQKGSGVVTEHTEVKTETQVLPERSSIDVRK